MNPYPVKPSAAYDPNDSTRKYFELDIDHASWDNGCILSEEEMVDLALDLLLKAGWSVNGMNRHITSVTPKERTYLR